MFVKIKLKAGVADTRTIYMRVLSVTADGSYYGFRIDTNTLDEKNCSTLPDGTIKETTELVHRSAIEKVSLRYEDIRYGGLTGIDISTQKIIYDVQE